MTRPITPKQITLIHTAKSVLQMDDADYRALLARFGVTSSKELSESRAEDLIRELRILGFKPVKNRRRKLGGNVVPMASPAQIALIDTLKDKVAWRNPDGFSRWLASRMGIEKVRTSGEARRVIEGLKHMAREEQ